MSSGVSTLPLASLGLQLGEYGLRGGEQGSVNCFKGKRPHNGDLKQAGKPHTCHAFWLMHASFPMYPQKQKHNQGLTRPFSLLNQPLISTHFLTCGPIFSPAAHLPPQTP